MKKIYIFIVLLALIVSSCNTGSENQPSQTQDISTSSSPEVIDTKTPGATPVPPLPTDFERVDRLNIVYPVFPGDKYLKINDWQKYIKEKFEIEIVVDYQNVFPESILSKTGERVLYLNYNKIFPSYSCSDVLWYSNAFISHDLSRYYEKYGWDKYINPSYIEKLTDNGRIYAIPIASEKYILPRYYRTEYLDAVNMVVPETVDEFYEYLKEVKQHNAADSTFYPMGLSTTYLTRNTADIFRAFGVYFDTEFNKSITYNPVTDSFEDGVYSDNVLSAFEYVRTLQDQGLMLIYGYSNYHSEELGANLFKESLYGINPNFATEYNRIQGASLISEPVYDYKSGYFLEGSNKENLAEVRSDIAFYIFPKNIKNIHGVVDLFNDIITHKKYYADLRYGMENIDYSFIGNNIAVTPPTTGKLPDVKGFQQVDDENVIDNTRMTEVMNGLPVSLKFEKNVFNHYWTYLQRTEGGRISSNSMNRELDALFSKDVSLEEAIDEYKNEFKKANIRELIEQINSRINKVIAYDYYN